MRLTSSPLHTQVDDCLILAAVLSIIVFLLILIWPFVAKMIKAIGAYIIAGLYIAFGLVATIGIPAIVVPASQDSQLIYVGLGTYW